MASSLSSLLGDDKKRSSNTANNASTWVDQYVDASPTDAANNNSKQKQKDSIDDDEDGSGAVGRGTGQATSQQQNNNRRR
jgi:hypothetical protein